MKKVLLASLALGFVVATLALSGGRSSTSGTTGGADLLIDIQDRNPWTHLKLNNDPDSFHFVVVSDRTGGHRARIFSMAIDQINLLQPSFVLSVGDLVEGYTKDKAKLTAEWREFQGYVHKLNMPFFYVPGNHDVTNALGEAEWKERFGRSYYHFVYKNVLFLCLNSSDPNEEKGKIQFSKEQIEYVEKALKENSSVRWTIVALHKPVWIEEGLEKSGFPEIEKALQGRKYTVFAGHVHRYQKFVRHGMNYYMLATTGGGSRLRGTRYGEFDHIVWATIGKDGPVLANIMLDGIYAEDMKKTYTDEDAYIRHGTKPPQPTKGRVTLDGAPVPGAQVVFHLTDPDPKKAAIRAAEAVAEGDGTFVLSTYSAWDGCPAGTYTVTVTLRVPFYEASGKPGPNRLPAPYASVKTSELRATVKTGSNEIELNLTSK